MHERSEPVTVTVHPDSYHGFPQFHECASGR